jgi:hypothetical protein
VTKPLAQKDPKSLYQSPSGATGPEAVHFWNRRRSDNGIRRSSTRLSNCCHSGRGRSANRIVGSSVRPENDPDHILDRGFLLVGFPLFQKVLVSCLEIVLGFFLSLNTARPASRQRGLIKVKWRSLATRRTSTAKRAGIVALGELQPFEATSFGHPYPNSREANHSGSLATSYFAFLSCSISSGTTWNRSPTIP